MVYVAGLRHQSLRWRGYESHSCHFVDIPIESYVFLYFEHLHIVSFTIIHAIDQKIYRQDGRVV